MAKSRRKRKRIASPCAPNGATTSLEEVLGPSSPENSPDQQQHLPHSSTSDDIVTGSVDDPLVNDSTTSSHVNIPEALDDTAQDSISDATESADVEVDGNVKQGNLSDRNTPGNSIDN